MIKIEAAARLKSLTTATTADDAGKVVMWIEKATGAKGKKSGKVGKEEKVAFTIKAGKDQINIDVSLDHEYEPPKLCIEGMSQNVDAEWYAEEATGRKTIIAFKSALKDTIAELKNEAGHEATVDILTKLVKAKSKVE